MNKKREKQYVYVAYSKKKPQLPIAVGDTADDLAAELGVKVRTVWEGISHKSCTYAKVRIDNV